ncbi:MAG: PIG-L family deacetylase [Streptosporangiaceae bacterium]
MRACGGETSIIPLSLLTTEADFPGLAGQAVQLIREFQPQAVVSFWPDGGYGHPDHITISATATAACQQAGNPRPGLT